MEFSAVHTVHVMDAYSHGEERCKSIFVEVRGISVTHFEWEKMR